MPNKSARIDPAAGPCSSRGLVSLPNAILSLLFGMIDCRLLARMRHLCVRFRDIQALRQTLKLTIRVSTNERASLLKSSVLLHVEKLELFNIWFRQSLPFPKLKAIHMVQTRAPPSWLEDDKEKADAWRRIWWSELQHELQHEPRSFTLVEAREEFPDHCYFCRPCLRFVACFVTECWIRWSTEGEICRWLVLSSDEFYPRLAGLRLQGLILTNESFKVIQQNMPRLESLILCDVEFNHDFAFENLTQTSFALLIVYQVERYDSLSRGSRNCITNTIEKLEANKPVYWSKGGVIETHEIKELELNLGQSKLFP
jgi:hypothetical protein